MPKLSCEIPQSVWDALEQRSRVSGEDTSRFVARVLERALAMPVHTLFQVSTSRALVQGVYQEAVSSAALLRHGDFGLGTFDELDGEMVVLDGTVYQVQSDGAVHRVDADAGTPFATVLRFAADETETWKGVASFAELRSLCDRHRTSENLFYAFRIDGRFSHVRTRAMRRTASGTSLKAAAETQPEFKFHDVAGTLVGFWSPQFAGAIDIPGYHFHFLSEDRTRGGHVLECAGDGLKMQVERVREFHLSMPDNEEFLRADLIADRSKDLGAAEGDHATRKL